MQFELHGFSDASNCAYAGVVYILSLYEDGGADVRLVASKTSVAQLKRHDSMPGVVRCSHSCLTRKPP